MDACSHCWSRYMEAMELSRRISDRMARRLLVREAYVWLQRYFDAEDREVARRARLAKICRGEQLRRS